MGKLKVAFFDFTSCNGCLLSMINHPEFVEVVSHVELADFRLVRSLKVEGPFDVSFVEGYPGDSHEIERLKKIREQSNMLVALGACACTGSIQSIRNFFDLEEAANYVYKGVKKDIAEVKPLDAYVEVDFYLPGCPASGAEAVQTLKALLVGRKPEIPMYAVCVECKLRETECVLVQGIPCLGPVTRGGCGAPCPAAGYICDGCRGPCSDPNVASEVEILRKLLGKEEIVRLFRRYASLKEAFKEVAEGKVE